MSEEKLVCRSGLFTRVQLVKIEHSTLRIDYMIGPFDFEETSFYI